MDSRLTIGQLAQAAGVPTSTVRYYERTGLLRPDGRTPHNYRYYDQSAVERLRFIRAAQSSGFSLSDAADLLKVRDHEGRPCDSVRQMVEKRLKHVQRQIRDLKQVQAVLREAKQACDATSATDHCALLDGLEQFASTPDR